VFTHDVCVEKDIADVTRKIEDEVRKVEVLEKEKPEKNSADYKDWRADLTAAREEKKQLREEKILLLKRETPTTGTVCPVLSLSLSVLSCPVLYCTVLSCPVHARSNASYHTPHHVSCSVCVVPNTVRLSQGD
jgi:hypothetical protein